MAQTRAGSQSDEMVKAGTENAADALSNFDEVERYLQPLPCLLGMLRSVGPVAYARDACAAELRGLPLWFPSMHAEMASTRAGRPNGWNLNASECGRTL